MTDVSVIYVNWNSAEEILSSVDSVRKRTGSVSYEIIVVDNQSAEGVDGLDGKGIRLIRNDRNAGFGTACNIGARRASGEFLFFLNPDTLLENDVLGELCSFLRGHPEAGGAGPLVLEEDGTIHFGAGRSFPSLANEFLEHTTIAFRFPRNRILGRPLISFWDHASTRPVDTLLGAAMMFRRSLFERIGGFDERFFLYYEETDLCKRVWDAGRLIYYVHTARLLHKGKRSTLKFYGEVDRMVFEYLESAWKFFRKHQGSHHAAFWRRMIAGIYLFRYCIRRKPVFLSYCRWAVKPEAARTGEVLPGGGRAGGSGHPVCPGSGGVNACSA